MAGNEEEFVQNFYGNLSSIVDFGEKLLRVSRFVQDNPFLNLKKLVKIATLSQPLYTDF